MGIYWEPRHFDRHLKWDKTSKWLAVLLAIVIPLSTTLTHIVSMVLFITWVLSGSIAQKWAIVRQHPVSKWVLILFGLFLLGMSYSKGSLQDNFGQLEKMSKLLYLPLLLPLMTEEKWRDLAIKGFIAAMIFTLLLSFLKVYGGLPFHSRHSEAALFKNHIDTNLLMSIALFFLAHYVFDLHVSLFFRVLSFILIPAFIYYILWMSEGRTGYIIFGMLWVLFLFQRFPKKYYLLGFAGLLAVGLSAHFSSKHFQSRLYSASDEMRGYQTVDSIDSNNSIGLRLQFSKETWELIKHHPWIGWGTGSFKTVYEENAKQKNLHVTRNPHNEYLNVGFQLGLMGFMALLALFVSILNESRFLPLRERYFIQGVVLAISLGSLANSWLMDITSGYAFVALSAFCLGALPLKKTYYSKASRGFKT